MENLNNSNIYHRELRIVAEFTINSVGAVRFPSKVKTQLNQLGVYELDLWEKFFEQYLLGLEGLFTAEYDEDEDEHLVDDLEVDQSQIKLLTGENVEDLNFLNEEIFNNPDLNAVQQTVLDEMKEKNLTTQINTEHDSDSSHPIIEKEALEDETDDVNKPDEPEFSLFVTIVIFFFKRKGKTVVYFTNPFVSPDLTQLIWLNTFDFYSLMQEKFEYFRFFPYHKKISLGLDII
jgi:hypothetical protein